MRACSLWQPWASAIALGLKRIETRGWSTKYRGPIAIHAAKRWSADQREFAVVEHTLGRLPKSVPLGAIVATCMLVDVRSTSELLAVGAVGPVEKIYGDYSPGRYGWILEDVVALESPTPFPGMQGLFNVPDAVIPEYARHPQKETP
jgi:hypothetical protein